MIPIPIPIAIPFTIPLTITRADRSHEVRRHMQLFVTVIKVYSIRSV